MTANALSVNSVNNGQTAAGVQKSAKTDAKTTASVFASLLNGNNYSTTISQNNVPQTADSGKKTDASDSYQAAYRDNAIEQAEDKNPIADTVEQASEELDQFTEDVVQTAAQELGVSEEDVRKAMETLGLTAFDLLNPVNLASLATELTGTAPMELLTDSSFQTLMQDLQTLGANLAETLDLSQAQMDELVAQMDVLAQPQETDIPTDAMTQTLQPEGTQQPVETAEIPTIVQPLETAEHAADAPAGEAVLKEETPQQQNVSEIEGQQAAGQENSQTPADGQPSEEQPQETAAQPSRTTVQTPQETLTQAQTQNFTADLQALTAETPTADISYLSVDTMDIIEQVAEQVRTNISAGTSTMEFQLTPENLGRVYVNVTSEKGVIHAQIAASSEAVRQALEAQVAQLRDNLNQAGVKVDAVEVTVASHEFEKNLEQGTESEKQQGERQQEQAGRRRNLNLSELDGLSGLMTEEEALAAQIMRDNGNSVDLTA